MLKKILFTGLALLLLISPALAGGVSLVAVTNSLIEKIGGDTVISRIDGVIEDLNVKSLTALQERALGLYEGYQKQEILTSKDEYIKDLVYYVYVKTIYELNPDLYQRDIQIEEKTKIVEDGDFISVHYIGKFEDGTHFDSSYERGESLSFTAGAGQMIRGFDAGVVGMKVGEKRTLTIAPKDAYGEREDKNIMIIKKTELQSFIDAGILLEKGVILPTQLGKFEIIAVNSDSVTVDTNNPLAGKTLVFVVELLSIK